jgi:hypothetical protein
MFLTLSYLALGMKNEDKIVELLSELLVRQERFEAGLDKLGAGLNILASSHERLIAIQERQEKILIKILEVLADDVPKFDEVIEMEQLEGGKKVVLRKYR